MGYKNNEVVAHAFVPVKKTWSLWAPKEPGETNQQLSACTAFAGLVRNTVAYSPINEENLRVTEETKGPERSSDLSENTQQICT